MGMSYGNKTGARSFDANHNITYSGFMPLCGQCDDDELITGEFTNTIGRKYGKTGAQVALRWLVQQRILTMPRAGSLVYQRDNLDIFDFACLPPPR